MNRQHELSAGVGATSRLASGDGGESSNRNPPTGCKVLSLENPKRKAFKMLDGNGFKLKSADM